MADSTEIVIDLRQPHTLILVDDGVHFAKLSEFVVGMEVREVCVLGDVGYAFYSPADAAITIHTLRRVGIRFTSYMNIDV